MARIDRRYKTGTFLVEVPLGSGDRITIELPMDVTRDELSRAARVMLAVAPDVETEVKSLTPGEPA